MVSCFCSGLSRLTGSRILSGFVSLKIGTVALLLGRCVAGAVAEMGKVAGGHLFVGHRLYVPPQLSIVLDLFHRPEVGSF